jgi:GAF domain-containing protein
MAVEKKIDIELFKVVSRSISESDDPELMCGHLTQLLTAAMGIKGCSLFALNPDTDELEILDAFGLSFDYINKGPILSARSIAATRKGEAIVIADIDRSDMLQYPQEAKAEGIRSIVSLPVQLHAKVIGALRLYHDRPWSPSQQDIDSLLVLGEFIGLALMYTRLRWSLETVRAAVIDIPRT